MSEKWQCVTSFYCLGLRLQNRTNPRAKLKGPRCGSKAHWKCALKKHVSNSVIRYWEGWFVVDDDDKCIQPTAPCAFKHDNTLASYVALLVSAFSSKKPLLIPSRPSLVTVVPPSPNASRLVRGPTIKYGSDEAEQRVFDNVGCDGAYYRIECVPCSIIHGIRLHSIARLILYFNRASFVLTFLSGSLLIFVFRFCLLACVIY